jgi:phospholipid/cholesterol/gamma-HCH transport system permease protein
MKYNLILGFFTFLGECFLLLWESMCRLFKKPFEFGEMVQQMAFIGFSSMPIVLLTTFFSGAVLGLYSTQILMSYGAGFLAGGTISLASAREISPVLAGLMVAARCGSAMTAQIGTMVVTEQVDALRSLNVHPVSYLVIPRLVACVLMVPMLCLLGTYSAILGGYCVALSKGLTTSSFLHSLQQFLVPWDYWAALLKTVVFGLIIGLISCQQGLRTAQGARGVGKSTTNAVVISMVLIYIANFFLSSVLYPVKG